MRYSWFSLKSEVLPIIESSPADAIALESKVNPKGTQGFLL
ncbi:hypothetical protein [uncultured Polaribacter sp.]|nr:hypothetical protein [uncultured Polaribacter sp.]